MNVNQYFTNIIDMFINDNAEDFYRKIMLSIIDIIESNEVLYVAEYQKEFRYSVDYWRHYEGTKQGLEECQKNIHAFFLLNKWSSLSKKNKKDVELNYLYRLIFLPFDEENLDRNCDNLYWFVSIVSSYGISQHQIMGYFEKYFDVIL